VDASNDSHGPAAYTVKRTQWGWEVLSDGVRLATYRSRDRAIEVARRLTRRDSKAIAHDFESDDT
jgi:hypothetical protein